MKSKIAESTIRTSPVLFSRLFAQAATLLLLARAFGPEAFGAFVGVAALATVTGVLALFGGHILVLAELSRTPNTPSQALPMAMATAMILGPTLALLFLIVSHSLMTQNAISPSALLLIALSEIVLRPFLSLASVQHQAIGSIATSQWIITLPFILRSVAAIFVLAYPGNDPVTIFALAMCMSMAISIFLATRGKNLVALPLGTLSWPSRRYLRNAAGYGFMNTATTAPSEADKTLATYLLTPHASGLYAISARALGGLTLPVSALMVSAMPRLFRESENGVISSTHLYWKIFSYVLLYAFIISASLWFAAPALEWALGPQYSGAKKSFQWMALAAPGMSLRIAAGQTLMSLEQPWKRAWIELLGLALLVALCVSLVPGHGIPAMILCIATTETMMAIAAWLAIFHRWQRGKVPIRTADS